jgi:hypothetical protein
LLSFLVYKEELCLQCDADGLKQPLKTLSIAADRENGLHYECTENTQVAGAHEHEN